MRTDKEICFSYRAEGNSYREIQKKTGIARSTLSRWFHGSDPLKNSSFLAARQNVPRETIQRYNLQRRLNLQYKYALALKKAELLYEDYRKNPLFFIGVTLYRCCGNSTSRSEIVFSSADSSKIKQFLHFCEIFLGLSVQDQSFRITCKEIVSHETFYQSIESLWQKELGIPSNLFVKPRIIKHSPKSSEKNEKETVISLQNTSLTCIITNTTIKGMLLRWCALAEKEGIPL